MKKLKVLHLYFGNEDERSTGGATLTLSRTELIMVFIEFSQAVLPLLQSSLSVGISPALQTASSLTSISNMMRLQDLILPGFIFRMYDARYTQCISHS